MSFLDNQSIMLSFQKYTDKHRDNIPALLVWDYVFVNISKMARIGYGEIGT